MSTKTAELKTQFIPLAAQALPEPSSSDQTTHKEEVEMITLERPTTMTGKRSPLRLAPMTNAERMFALDEAWNARDWDTFDYFHDGSDAVVYWAGREESPTRGGAPHRAEAERFCRAFPDNKVLHPYPTLFGEGDFTCFVIRFTGTFTAPLELPDATVIQSSGKSFDLYFSTAARWRKG